MSIALTILATLVAVAVLLYIGANLATAEKRLLYRPLYEYQPTMIHCKVMVIDGAWTSVGSANFDERSFRLNDEANLNVFCEALASEQVRQIEADISRSKRMIRPALGAAGVHETYLRAGRAIDAFAVMKR